MYSLRSCLPLANLSSSDLIAWVKQCLVNLTGVHQVAGVPCANIDLKEWVKRNVWDMKIPWRWNRGWMQRTSLEDERVWYVSFVFLALKVTRIRDFCLASDFHNEDDGSYFKVFQHLFEVFFLHKSVTGCNLFFLQADFAEWKEAAGRWINIISNVKIAYISLYSLYLN